MSSKYLAGIISLVIIFVFSEQAFAWNQPPVANLEVSPTHVLINQDVLFDGSSSYDPDIGDGIVEYSWDLNGDGDFTDPEDYTETEGSAPDGNFDGEHTHQYTSKGTYHVRMRVKDEHDAYGYSDYVDVYVYENYSVYVDKNVDGGDENGESWDNAYKELRDALEAEEEAAIIYVAEGTYTPGDESSDSFELKYFMEIHGGFSPVNEADDPGEQDPSAYPTILSGDIGDEGVKTDNCHRVVQGSHGIILTGLTIKAGNNDQSYIEGGGLYCSGDAEIINCIFENNGGAYYYGGAVCNYGDDNTQNFTNCVFSGNEAFIGGAVSNAVAYDNKANTQEFVNCIFTGNNADDGGAVISYLQDTTFINCTFYGNEASDDAGGVYADESTMTVTNCIFWGNTDGDGSTKTEQEQLYDDESDITVSYSCIQGGWSGAGNINYYPYFVNAKSGDCHLKSFSPCIDAGDNSDHSNEPDHPEGKINMGAYGNTAEAAIACSSSDGDNIPDCWETLYWPNDNPSGHAEDEDFDRDNVENIEEYHTGTNPTLTDAPIDIKFTLEDAGDGRLRIKYTTYNNVEIRSIALKVVLEDATVKDPDLYPTVVSYQSEFNCFTDYANYAAASYTLGSGHPLANASGPGLPAFDTSIFSINMACFDESGNQLPAPASSDDLINLQLTKGVGNSTDVTVSEDTLRSSFTNDGITTNLPLTIRIQFGS